MLNKNAATLLTILVTVFAIDAPALAHESGELSGRNGLNLSADSSNSPKRYLAQNDQSGSEDQQGESEESGQKEETDQQPQASEQSEEPSANLSSFLPGGGGGGRVSLATLFVQAVAMGIAIVLLVSIPISFTCVLCALVWKIGMVARGGKKPDIG